MPEVIPALLAKRCKGAVCIPLYIQILLAFAPLGPVTRSNARIAYEINMRYLKNESVWLLWAPAGEDYEIAVPGDSGGPIPALRDLANRVLPNVASLRMRAIALFDEFIRPEVFSEQSHWHFEGVDLGHPIRYATGRFRLTFSRDGDTYGK